jgi:hypothetical protein
MSQRKPSLYLVSILLFMLILPIGYILYQWQVSGLPLGWLLIGKWFLFWAVGVRLFIAGLRQVTKPAFTAKEIFHIESEESYVVIRELGFANLCFGTLGILSLFKPEWCQPAAVAGGLYFGLAGVLHLFKKPDSRNESIALISDLYILAIMGLYLFFTW